MEGGAFREELGVCVVEVLVAWSARFPVGVLVREACCREVLPLVVEYLKVEGELERVDTGLPRVEASFILLASIGSREVGDTGEVGEMGESTSCLAEP